MASVLAKDLMSLIIFSGLCSFAVGLGKDRYVDFSDLE